ncbi:MAG: ATP-binding cassette domain-containing protein [Planctomycetota bacterium]
MNPTAIEIRGLHKHYGSVHALRGVHLVLPSGTVGLLGPNGAGKTTLLKLLLGMLAPDGGQARIADLDPAKASERLAIRQRVGYMPESDCLVPGMSAVELVALMGRLAGMPRTDAMTRAHEVLDYVGTGEERYRKNEEYSTGMKQRIKLAQALVRSAHPAARRTPTAWIPKAAGSCSTWWRTWAFQGGRTASTPPCTRNDGRPADTADGVKGGQVVQQGDPGRPDRRQPGGRARHCDRRLRRAGAALARTRLARTARARRGIRPDHGRRASPGTTWCSRRRPPSHRADRPRTPAHDPRTGLPGRPGGRGVAPARISQ